MPIRTLKSFCERNILDFKQRLIRLRMKIELSNMTLHTIIHNEDVEVISEYTYRGKINNYTIISYSSNSVDSKD